MASLLVKGAILITQDATRRVLRGDLRVDDGRITAVGGDLGEDADEVIDASGDLVMPGLVNAHTHSPMTLLRGLGDDLPLEEWLRTRIWPAEAKLTRDDVVAGTQLALLEMVRSGTTCFNDMYFFAEATAESAAAAGVRALVGATLIDFDTPELKRDEQEPFARRFVAKWKGHALVTPTISPHATYTCGHDTLERIRTLRDELGVRIHTHCSETRTEVQDVLEKRGKRPVEVLASHGLLDDAMLAHCGWVTKEEIRTMAAAGAHALHCPVSNLKLATGGIMPMVEMLDAGQNVALGTDGAASNNALDMLETTKYAALLQKNHRWDARAAPAQTVLDLATRGGAAAVGMRDELGSLEPGKRADFVIVSTRAPHMVPLHDPVSTIVYAAHGSDVRATIVDGRVLYLDGAFRTLDVDNIRKGAMRSAERIARENGARGERPRG